MDDSLTEKEVLSAEFPQVKFGLDEGFDIWKICEFIVREANPGGSNFQQRIFHDHPELQGVEALPKAERDSRIEQYVKKYYQEHKDQLEAVVPQINKAWQVYAPSFFQAAGELFKGLPWPDGEYKGLITISQPCPRFLDRKLFQVPAETGGLALRVAGHEMLHFLFFEYVRKRYTPQLAETSESEMSELLKGRFQIPLWELSEVFNTALQTEERFGQMGFKNVSSYPGLVDYLKMFNILWQETNGDIDLFFSKLEVS